MQPWPTCAAPLCSAPDWAAALSPASVLEGLTCAALASACTPAGASTLGIDVTDAGSQGAAAVALPRELSGCLSPVRTGPQCATAAVVLPGLKGSRAASSGSQCATAVVVLPALETSLPEAAATALCVNASNELGGPLGVYGPQGLSSHGWALC